LKSIFGKGAFVVLGIVAAVPFTWGAAGVLAVVAGAFEAVESKDGVEVELEAGVLDAGVLSLFDASDAFGTATEL